jgi:hypothetical protein
MSDDFIMLVYMLVYEMFIGVCLLCFGAVLTSSLLSVTQRAFTPKALRRLFDPNHRPEENGSEWRVANSEWFSGVFWRAVLPHCRKFSAHQEMCPPVLLVFIATDLKRVVGRGTRDGMNWEGEAPAEQKTAASGE